MDQLKKLLAALSLRQRITIAIVAFGVIGAMFAFAHWHKEGDFKPLFTALSPEDAAAVIQKLKESGTEYRVSENGSTVLAPSTRVAEARLELAAAGIPKTGRIGFELFDKTNLGATEFTEHLNYHRALEGELERSIDALSAVDQSRVHLTFPKESVFLDSRQSAKASVLLKLRIGAQLSGQNVAAITNLVASAVEGLTPDAVSVLDMRGNLLNRPHHDLPGDQPSEVTLEYRQKIENDLLNKVNSTLEPLLGADKFRAGVSVECDFSSGEQSEETLDPSKSVMVSSQKTEEQTGSNLSSGQPGTASSLPRPTSRPGSSASGVSRRTENIAYQSSRVVRHVKLPQGTVKRMSISVLVDHSVHMEGKGDKAKRVIVPPSAETLKVIHDLVAAATGFSVERGDQLVIESLPFDSTRNFEPLTSPVAKPIDPRVPKWLTPYVQDFSMLLFAGAAGAAFLFVVVALVFMMIRKKPVAVALPNEITGPLEAQKVISPADTKMQHDAQLAESAALESVMERERDGEAASAYQIPVTTTKKAEVLIKSLKQNIAKDAMGTTNVLRTWLAEAERAKRGL